MPAQQCKRFTLTAFFAEGTTTEEAENLMAYCYEALSDTEEVTFLMGQCELTPTTGRLHFQGYAVTAARWTVFKFSARLQDVCAMVEEVSGFHLEAATGSFAHNVRYCSKEDTRAPGANMVYLGCEPNADDTTSRERGASLESMLFEIKKGSSMTELTTKFGFTAFLHHHNAITKAMALWGPKRSEKPTILLLIGKSGTGKSLWADKEFPDRFRMTFGNGGNAQWWDGYMGEKVVELSEFRGQLPLSFMLDLLDRYQLKVQVKGATMQMLATTFVITSNEQPKDWYAMTEDRSKLDPLLRRLEEFGRTIDYEYQNSQRMD